MPIIEGQPISRFWNNFDSESDKSYETMCVRLSIARELSKKFLAMGIHGNLLFMIYEELRCRITS